MSGSGIIMQVCTSLQTDNHASIPPLSFYRADALSAAQLTASKHWSYFVTNEHKSEYDKSSLDEPKVARHNSSLSQQTSSCLYISYSVA